MKKIISFLYILAMLFVAVRISPVMASPVVIYSTIPDVVPGNVPSVGYEANSASEFGGQVQFIGTDRTNPMVTVLMSSWGCEFGGWNTNDCQTTTDATFTHPITLNIYEVNLDNSPGLLIKSVTQTFTMPFRPSVDTTNCTGGKWFNGAECFNGKAFTISFNLAGFTLPDKLIVGVAYNTSHYGAIPIGTTECSNTTAGCAYDSLNVGTYPTPLVGTALPTVNDAYLNSSWSGAYCDGGLGTGTFRLDASCWTGYLPAVKIEAQSASLPPPTNTNQCKNDGWKIFNSPTFKNQGTCVSYVEPNPKAGKK